MRTLLPTCLALAMALPPHPATAQPLEITLTEGTNFAAAASPDGQTFALDLQGTLWTVPADGGQATAITDAYGDSRQPVWSPDGSKIAFTSNRDGNDEVYCADVRRGKLKRLTRNQANDSPSS